MTREEAIAAARVAAATVFETDVDQAAARLMERLSVREDASELRDALAELGARAILRERAASRGGTP